MADNKRYESVLVSFATDMRPPDSKHPEPWYEGYFIITPPAYEGAEPRKRVAYKDLPAALLELLS